MAAIFETKTMNNEPGEVKTPGLPSWLVETIERLIPASNYEEIQTALRARKDARSYLAESFTTIPPALAGSMRISFDRRKVLGEVCCLCFGFFAALEFWPPMAAVILIALLALRIRDALIYPAQGLPGEAATDGLVMGGAVVLSQAFFIVAAPVLVLPAYPLAQGIALGMLLQTIWRLYFHSVTPGKRLPEYKPYRETLRINALFFIAWITMTYTNGKAVPGNDVQDFLLAALPPVAAGIAYKIIKGGGSIFWESPAQMSVFTNPADLSLERQRDSLPAPKPPRNQTTARYFKLGAFAILSIPFGIAFWRWHTGEGVVYWRQILPNIPAMIALAALWSVIERKNRQTAALLAEEAKRRK